MRETTGGWWRRAIGRDGYERQDEAGRLRSRQGLELQLICVVVGLALALRFAELRTIPSNITADEADQFWTIFRIQEIGEPTFFGFDWKPAPAFSQYLFMAFMRVFGDDIVGLRSASAVISALALVPFYFLARRECGRVASLAGTVLLATSVWYLNFSRSGWENVHTCFFALMAAWCLTLALDQIGARGAGTVEKHASRRSRRRRASDRRRRRCGRFDPLTWLRELDLATTFRSVDPTAYALFAAAGIWVALGLYGYFSGRMIAGALLVYLPVALWLARREWWQVIAGYTLLAAVAAALFYPQLENILTYWEVFNRRVDDVSVLRQPLPYEGNATTAGVLWYQLERTVRAFFLMDGSLFYKGRYSPIGEPILDRATGTLLLIGLAIGLFRWRQTALWWCLLLVPLLTTQVLSTETPDAARALTAAPFMYLFVALALDRLVSAPSFLRTGRSIVVVAAVAIVATQSVREYRAWVLSSVTVESRQPAIELPEFDAWQQAHREEARRGEPGFNVYEWRERVERERLEQERQRRLPRGLP